MAIITEDTPLGYALPPISRKLDVGLNQVKTNDGGLDTIHTDPEAAAREGLEKPIAVGSRIFGVIPRMMMLCFDDGWIVGGKGSVVTRRSAGIDDLVTAKGYVSKKTPEGDDKLRVECEVWVETDKGEKVMVGQCSGLVARTT
jgi:acyl dehydratase